MRTHNSVKVILIIGAIGSVAWGVFGYSVLEPENVFHQLYQQNHLITYFLLSAVFLLGAGLFRGGRK